MSLERLSPWALRLAWVLMPASVGTAVASAVDGRSAAVATTAAAGAWAVWAVVLVASLVAHPAALAVTRVGVPAAVAASAVAAFAGAGAVTVAVAAMHAVVTTGIAFLPETALHAVNGPAYVNERRYPLRVPGPLLLGPLPLAWLGLVLLPTAGALLLASRSWVLGVLATAAGIAVGVGFARPLLALARRWLVFVPAGVVVHDPIRLVDPVLIRREDLTAIALAEEGTTAKDLTAGALGMAIEISVRGPAPLTVLGRRGQPPVTHTVEAVLVAPTRPGAVLAEAAERRLDRAAEHPEG